MIPDCFARSAPAEIINDDKALRSFFDCPDQGVLAMRERKAISGLCCALNYFFTSSTSEGSASISALFFSVIFIKKVSIARQTTNVMADMMSTAASVPKGFL